MENAQLIALSRQIALQRQMDVVANNMANLNTTGFKGEALQFEDYLMPVDQSVDFGWGDELLHYTQDWGTRHNLMPGAIAQTGNPLDIALQGDGYLTILTPAGERFTRNGALSLNESGELVTMDGYQVAGEGGPIVFAPGETGITLGADGAVRSSAGSKGMLQIAEFDDPQSLTREGSTLFVGEGALPAIATRVVQGAIERSNVSGITEMSEMIRITRSYTSLAKLMEQQDQLRQQAIQSLGSLSA